MKRSLRRRYVAYLEDNPNHYWFRRKLFGWGWTPATWEGWAILLIYLVLLIGLVRSRMLDEGVSSKGQVLTFVTSVIVLTLVLLLITYLKGEPPRWQWGLPKDEEDTQDEN